MFVLIDKKLDQNGRFKKVKVFGSMAAIAKEGIEFNGKKATERMISWRLKADKTGIRIFNGERYFIKECPLIRSKREN